MSDSHQYDFLQWQGCFFNLLTDTPSLPPEWADDPHAFTAMASSTNYGSVGATSSCGMRPITYANQTDYPVINPMSVNFAMPYDSGQAFSLVSPSHEPPNFSFRAHASPERPRAADNLSEVIHAKCFFDGPCYVLSPDKVLTPADVRRHLLECHRPASGFAKDDVDKKLRCLWHNKGGPCMTTVKDEVQLVKHVATHHFKLFEISCSSCGGKFSRKDSLKRHNAEVQCTPPEAAGACE
ncbi:hypothetical protein DAEQUDRAFT_738750 [Daedalea quercina L-15889]|uniref:C2H2-type domain-containing protein n=1 Tax=Daedalea quercina L-15889 TaxID=1314783 RepID=A0A165PLE6_9APHY|nr:hypothetical protein DAEQUDRAFT_738750 [Daedalea quercina L-15889]